MQVPAYFYKSTNQKPLTDMSVAGISVSLYYSAPSTCSMYRNLIRCMFTDNEFHQHFHPLHWNVWEQLKTDYRLIKRAERFSHSRWYRYKHDMVQLKCKCMSVYVTINRNYHKLLKATLKSRQTTSWSIKAIMNKQCQYTTLCSFWPLKDYDNIRDSSKHSGCSMEV